MLLEAMKNACRHVALLIAISPAVGITSDAWRVCCEGFPAATDALTETANVRLVKRIDIGAVW